MYPRQEWILTRDVEGGIISTLYHHELGIISEVSSYKFERGDIANIQFTPFVNQTTRTVSQGDTVGHVRSYLLEERLNSLRLQLNVEKARLKSESAGAKGPVIAEARQKLAFAQEQLKLSGINYERARALYRDAVISEADYNTAENEFKLAEIQIRIAQSGLDAAQMGQKPELLELILATMNGLENELRFLESKRTGYAIVAPISGTVDYTVIAEQVLSVYDTAAMVMTVPIKLSQQTLVKPGTPIWVRVPGLKEKLVGKVVDINRAVQILENQQVLLVKAEIEHTPSTIRKGMMVECQFQCDTVSLWGYLNRLVGQWSR